MGRPWLEAFKFATYLAVPIALTATFALDPANLNGVIRNVRQVRAFVVSVADARAIRESTDERRAISVRDAARVRGVPAGGAEAAADEAGARRAPAATRGGAKRER